MVGCRHHTRPIEAPFSRNTASRRGAQQPTRVGVGLRPDQADPGRNFEALVVELDLEFGVAGLRPGERVDQLVEALGRFEKTHRRTHRDLAAADASTVTETES